MIINIKKTEKDYESHYGVIYRITNTENQRVYIGQTVNFKRRIYNHCRSSKFKDGPDYNYPLYRAIRKYGEDKFIADLVDYAESFEELNEKEIQYIKEYRTLTKYGGYNQNKGGIRGTEETRDHMKVGRPSTRGSKNVNAQKVRCVETGQEFGSVVDCAIVIFKDPMAKKSIADCANPNRKLSSYKGLHFVRI